MKITPTSLRIPPHIKATLRREGKRINRPESFVAVSILQQWCNWKRKMVSSADEDRGFENVNPNAFPLLPPDQQPL